MGVLASNVAPLAGVSPKGLHGFKGTSQEQLSECQPCRPCCDRKLYDAGSASLSNRRRHFEPPSTAGDRRLAVDSRPFVDQDLDDSK